MICVRKRQGVLAQAQRTKTQSSFIIFGFGQPPFDWLTALRHCDWRTAFDMVCSILRRF
jgi:hypothetical protein